MAASIRAIFLVVCVLSWCSNVLSTKLSDLPKCPKSEGVELPENIRSAIYEEVSKWTSKKPEYSCYLEGSAALTVLKNKGRSSSDDEVEMLRTGRWTPTFISDAVKWWAPELKKMTALKSIGCFYRASESGKKTARLACVFKSS
ncbi:hypothetical protein Y032_0081g1426 [Ancylostoma ceylanicum]|uniref:SCP domain-containing protein n=1 Tax=Ancylostoma ceylanicum TaxID=53326 RepID=A0A016TS39_9BILA|nr:hypothetical protein Y032_0081g1426 [Ancylostoma ceylanicum]